MTADGQIIEIAGKWIGPCIWIASFSDETPVNGVTARHPESSVPGGGNEIAESYFTNHLCFFAQRKPSNPADYRNSYSKRAPTNFVRRPFVIVCIRRVTLRSFAN